MARDGRALAKNAKIAFASPELWAAAAAAAAAPQARAPHACAGRHDRAPGLPLGLHHLAARGGRVDGPKNRIALRAKEGKWIGRRAK